MSAVCVSAFPFLSANRTSVVTVSSTLLWHAALLVSCSWIMLLVLWLSLLWQSKAVSGPIHYVMRLLFWLHNYNKCISLLRYFYSTIRVTPLRSLKCGSWWFAFWDRLCGSHNAIIDYIDNYWLQMYIPDLIHMYVCTRTNTYVCMYQI